MIKIMSKNLEYRIYGLVPYNISPIQQGIQYGHGVVEYVVKRLKKKGCKQWSKKDKTFIILNGGTTNLGLNGYLGSMNKHLKTLVENDIKIKCFYEPDLGDQLTAIVFLVDERVFNKEKYPDDFDDEFTEDWTEGISDKKLRKILFLRNFLPQFRLA
jgi:hypothetical protein